MLLLKKNKKKITGVVYVCLTALQDDDLNIFELTLCALHLFLDNLGIVNDFIGKIVSL